MKTKYIINFQSNDKIKKIKYLASKILKDLKPNPKLKE